MGTEGRESGSRGPRARDKGGWRTEEPLAWAPWGLHAAALVGGGAAPPREGGKPVPSPAIGNMGWNPVHTCICTHTPQRTPHITHTHTEPTSRSP